MKIQDVCILFADGDWIESKDQSQNGIRLIQTGNIGIGHFVDKDDRAKYISADTFEQLKCTEVFPGDVLISRLPDPVGRGCIIPEISGRMITAVDCTICRVNEDVVDKKYFCYYLQSSAYSNQLDQNVTGTTRKRISRKNLGDVEISIPSKGTQQQIVSVLDRISSIIAERQQQLDELDNLVKARFVEMFGDRDSFAAFPLESNVEEMFIGPFGSSLKNECFVPENEGYCMVYEQKHAIRKTMNVETRYVTEEKYKELKRFNVQGGDIIVSCRGTIGETYIVPENAPLGIMHPSIMKIRLKSSAYNNVFFDFLLQDTLQKHNTDANGSGVKMAVTANTLGKEVFIQPAMHIQNRFAAFVAEVDKSKLAVKQSLEKLETLKKSLMQQYFG